MGILVAVTDDLVVTKRITVPAAELTERFSRASGPGGQGVNTTDSRVELRFDVAASRSLPPPVRDRILQRLDRRLASGVLTVVASEHRAQRANRNAARARMAALLREAAAPPPPPRRQTKPSRRSVERRLTEKRHRSAIKRDRRRGQREE